MFNIIFQGAGWKDDNDCFDISRVLEHTDPEVRAIYAPARFLDVDKVKKIPTIFAAESDYDDAYQMAKVGRITNLRMVGTQYIIEYVCDGPIKSVSNAFLEKHQDALHLHSWEFTRTHWAIKDVDLYKFLLSTQIRTPEDFGPTASPSSSEGARWLLHEKIIQASWGLYSGGHYRSAVLDSMLALVQMVQEKSGIRHLDGVQLMQYVFSTKDPHLLISANLTDSQKNEHEGYLLMLSGAMKGIRNPSAHELAHGLDNKSALQHLIFASMLAHRIEEADVVL